MKMSNLLFWWIEAQRYVISEGQTLEDLEINQN